MNTLTETRCGTHHLMRCPICPKPESAEHGNGRRRPRRTFEPSAIGSNDIPVSPQPATPTAATSTPAASAPATTPVPIPVFDSSYASVPATLKAENIWLAFELAWNPETGKFTKKPHDPKTGKVTNQPSLGVSFADALAFVSARKNFVLGLYIEKPYLGMDLDGCRDKETGVIADWAQSIITEADSYAEISPSGTGVRIIMIGEKPGDFCRRGSVEIYSHLRGVTITGLHISGTSDTVNKRDITTTYKRMVAGEFIFSHYGDKSKTGDTKLLGQAAQIKSGGKAVTSKLGLLMTGTFTENAIPFVVADEYGNTLEYDSQSNAIAALLVCLGFKHDCDAEKMEQDFLSSCLYQNITKWNALDGKWSRLGKTEIAHAIDFCKKSGKSAEKAYVLQVPQNVVVTSLDDLEARDPDDVSPLGFLKEIPKDAASAIIRSLGIKVEEPNQAVDEAQIPAFDPSVMTGSVYEKFVNLVTAGTTLQPQYAYQMARLLVSMLIVGRVKFENLADVPPLRHLVFLGETGSGKGATFVRSFDIMTRHQTGKSFTDLQGVDSGAGIKDNFFENPRLPALLYIDEAATLGHKSSDKRNPDILDVMGEMAGTTRISRVLSTRGGTVKGRTAAKTMDNAYLFWVICAPNGMEFMSATCGRKVGGFNDRNIPVFGVPVKPGKLPDIPSEAIAELWAELYKIQAMVGTPKEPGTARLAPEAEVLLDAFWESQPTPVFTKVRYKQNLLVDAFLNAIGRGRMTVLPEDAENAIKDARRELATRATCFVEEASDRVGFYYSKLKSLTAGMEKEIRVATAGTDVWEEIAKSESDFEHDTRATANNEPEAFARAWKHWAPRHLEAFPPRKTKNGMVVIRYVPARPER